jgi:hypothetical protein
LKSGNGTTVASVEWLVAGKRERRSDRESEERPFGSSPLVRRLAQGDDPRRVVNF